MDVLVTYYSHHYFPTIRVEIILGLFARLVKICLGFPFFVARSRKCGYNIFIMEAPSPRDELIVLFLRGLRIVLNNASAYAIDHPYFIKSVHEFREKITPVFDVLEPVWIHCAPDSLTVDGRTWQKNALYTDLAALFHYRKIKCIGFTRDVTVDELLVFFGVVGMPRRDFLRKGGCRHLLKGSSKNIRVEELDYSGFLGEGGTVEVDVWVFLLGEALERDDTQKLKNLADTFGKVTAGLKPSDLAQDTELHDKIQSFMGYVKEHYHERLVDCTRELFGVLQRNKTGSKDEDIEKIKTFFREVDNESLARMLWDELAVNKAFDATSFLLYNRLIDRERHQAVVDMVGSCASSRGVQETQLVAGRLSALLDSTGGDTFSPLYRKMLSGLVEHLAFNKRIDFDRDRAHQNYLFILLSLLRIENNRERVADIGARIGKEWERIIQARAFDFITALSLLVAEKEKRGSPDTSASITELRTGISRFVETLIWEGSLPENQAVLLDSMTSSSLGADRFIAKMCDEEKVNASLVSVFLRLFPQAVPQLQEALTRKSHSVDFLVKFIGSLKGGSAAAAGLLEYIYAVSNDFIKIEALKAMETLPAINEAFVFSSLAKSEYPLKRAAFSVLARRDSTRPRALEAFFNIQSFLGSANKLLLDHLSIVGELGLEKEAYTYLEALSRRPFFWNSPVRQRAKALLEKMYARKR